MLHNLIGPAAGRLGRQLARDEAVDRMISAYVDWREAAQAVREAYDAWNARPRTGCGLPFGVYLAALGCEERAAAAYAATVEEVVVLLLDKPELLAGTPKSKDASPGSHNDG